ncbi:MAG: hypothetical protein KAG96_03735 [Ichthyobacteriaceae bacterium]|nr:hypothetical protein [Ichthyobacteriaceae bacterium]
MIEVAEILDVKNITEEIKLKVSDLDISVADLKEYLSPTGEEIPQYFIDISNEEISKLNNFYVSAGYTILPATTEVDLLKISEEYFNVGKEIIDQLRKAEYVAVYAVTVGNELENELLKYDFQTQMSEAYIVDIIGNVIVEKTALYIQNKVAVSEKKKSLKTTNSLSPGNCGWDIIEQFKLFNLLPDNFLGITLNNSGMMYPSKSLSGMIGIGKKARFLHSDCKTCSSKNCVYRKK